jgi:hypothetical protein
VVELYELWEEMRESKKVETDSSAGEMANKQPRKEEFEKDPGGE